VPRGAGRLGENGCVRSHGSQRGEKLGGVALAEHREDSDQSLGADEATQSITGLQHCGWIVTAVQDDSRLSRGHLETSRPTRRPETLADLIVGDLVQEVRGTDREGGVGGLIVAYQRQLQVRVLEARAGHAKLMSAPTL